MPVTFSYADRVLTLAGKRNLKRFIANVLLVREGKMLGQLNYVFCSDEYLLDLNKRFLNHDYYTDIITFDLSSPGEAALVGEVYISVDRVRENANALGVPFDNEMKRVIFHGVLHLCGYTDKGQSAIRQMRAKENEYLVLTGLG
jgi:rRNA maturation RNase YbeY